MDPEFTKLQKQGQELYKQKDYVAALKCFNSVISQCVDPPISLLDNRAATSSKLGDYQRALSDGKRMISLRKDQVTVRLRAPLHDYLFKILQLMQKNDLALGIYKYGMKNVPIGNEDFKLLRGIYDKLATKCSPPKAVDPLLVLPTELVEMVFQYLNLQNLVNLLRVSKQWKTLLESMPKLWRNLDLSSAKRIVSFQAIKACVLRSRGSVTHATLDKWLRNGKARESLVYITSRCRGLEYLNFQSGNFNDFLLNCVTMLNGLKTLIVSSHIEVSLVYVCRSLNTLHCLERAEFHNIAAEGNAQWTRDLSRLRILTLKVVRSYEPPRYLQLEDLLSRIPHIQDLTVKAWKTRYYGAFSAAQFASLTELRNLNLAHLDLTAFPCLAATVESLTLISVGGLKSRSGDIIPYPNLPALISLTFSATCYTGFSDIHALLNHSKSKLQKLGLLDCIVDPLETASCLADGHLSELTDLSLTNGGVTDELAVLIAKHCPKLQRLNASYNTKLTGVGVKALVLKEGPMLRSLGLVHCSGVSVDAVKWARDKGVEVCFSFPDNQKFARHVTLW